MSKKAILAAMLVAPLIQPGLLILPAQAQAQAGEFNLPPQDLAVTLRAIARQGGREVLFADADVRGRRAPAVRGRLTTERAVSLAIVGSGLELSDHDGALVVRLRTQTTGDSDAEGTITVTGTRIRGASGPSPVTIVSRRGLEEQGIPDLTGLSRILPQNYTGGQNPGVAGGGDQGGYNNLNNSTTLNLRGLGSDATLTLINGHRLPYDALNQGVDISTIPLAALERIEVITDGASALYGSDAVGGVANIMLRRDYEGLQASARLGTSTEGGNTQQQYSGVTGARWQGGGLMVALDYTKATPIYADDRPYSRQLQPTQMLATGSRQVSSVLAGHHDLASWLSFEVDAQLADRRSRKANVFSVTAPVTYFGQISMPIVRSYAVTPSLRIQPGGGWEAVIEATQGASSTVNNARRYTNGVLLVGYSAYDNYLSNYEISAEGPLLRLPGGDARLAFGGGYRRFRLDILVRTTTGGVTRVTRDTEERRESLFGYGELSVPLVGEANRRPWLEALRLSGALRYERYEGIDAVATPKLGLVYAPHRDVTLKYSWGRSFKIPTLNQVNQNREAVLLAASRFAPQPSPPLPPGSTVLLVGGGNPDLRAERATSSTFTAEFRPRFLDGLRLEASWFDIDYRGRIASPISDTLSSLTNPAAADFVLRSPTKAQLDALIASAPLGLGNQSGAPYDPALVAFVVDASLRNTARERVRGVDIAFDYSAPLGADSQLRLSGSASYLDAKRQGAASLPSERRSGIIFTPPKFRARGTIGWEGAAVQLSGSINYAEGTLDNRFPQRVGLPATATVDLSGAYRPAGQGVFSNLELRLNVQNLLNREPDFIRTSDPSSVAFDSTNQSPIGRFVSVSVTKQW